MFDPIYDFLAQVLSFFYDIIPNYAIAIAWLTVSVMVLTTPFTLKGTRSMIQMQRLQPEMKKLQTQYKDDRQKLNEELMAFYKENNLNPLGGCLPLLLQAPIFFFLFNVLRGLTYIPKDETTFDPKYLDESSKMYRSLDGATEMMSFGIDLAESASVALKISFVHALPQIGLVLIVALTSYYQQKQIQSRNPGVEVPQQQQILMKLMPLMMVFFAFVTSAALVVYFITSNLYRIGMQYYITRTLYQGEDSLGAQAQRASAETKKLKEADGTAGVLPRLSKQSRALPVKGSTVKPAAKATPPSSTPSASSNGASAEETPAPRSVSNANRSKKKKKRR